MQKDCENRYKTCRNATEFTQEQASELLNISVRTLSDYENGKTPVPEDIVVSMVKAYNSPLLAYYHMKENSPLGAFLPDIMPPQSYTDVAYQLIIAQDDLAPAVEAIKTIMRDGMVQEWEEEDYQKAVSCLEVVNGKIMSVILHAKGRVVSA